MAPVATVRPDGGSEKATGVVPPPPVVVVADISSWSMSEASTLLVVPYRIWRLLPATNRDSGDGRLNVVAFHTHVAANVLSPSGTHTPAAASNASNVQVWTDRFGPR